MDCSCKSFSDLVRINGQIVVAQKYLSMLREAVSINFGWKFLRNFEAVNRQLLSLDAQLSATPSSLAEKEEAVSRLNDSATAIFAQWDSVLSSQQELAPTAASTIKDISFADSLKEATILIANVLNKGTLCL